MTRVQRDIIGVVLNGMLCFLCIVLWPFIIIIDIMEKRAVRRKYR